MLGTQSQVGRVFSRTTVEALLGRSRKTAHHLVPLPDPGTSVVWMEGDLLALRDSAHHVIPQEWYEGLEWSRIAPKQGYYQTRVLPYSAENVRGLDRRERHATANETVQVLLLHLLTAQADELVDKTFMCAEATDAGRVYALLNKARIFLDDDAGHTAERFMMAIRRLDPDDG